MKRYKASENNWNDVKKYSIKSWKLSKNNFEETTGLDKIFSLPPSLRIFHSLFDMSASFKTQCYALTFKIIVIRNCTSVFVRINAFTPYLLLIYFLFLLTASLNLRFLFVLFFSSSRTSRSKPLLKRTNHDDSPTVRLSFSLPLLSGCQTGSANLPAPPSRSLPADVSQADIGRLLLLDCLLSDARPLSDESGPGVPRWRERKLCGLLLTFKIVKSTHGSGERRWETFRQLMTWRFVIIRPGKDSGRRSHNIVIKASVTFKDKSICTCINNKCINVHK